MPLLTCPNRQMTDEDSGQVNKLGGVVLRVAYLKSRGADPLISGKFSGLQSLL